MDIKINVNQAEATMDIFKMFGDFAKSSKKIEKELPGFNDNNFDLKFENENEKKEIRKKCKTEMKIKMSKLDS